MIATTTLRPELPDYLPARMVNEFVYCPRLFYYEWVAALFAHNQETVEGAIRHAKIDATEGELPTAAQLAESGEQLHTRSIQLASDTHRLIAKIDIVEAEEGEVTPIDYKRGRPRENSATGALEAWDTDRVQICVQALVLRENGYRCTAGIAYYAATKQRVRIPIDDALVEQTLAAARQAWSLAEAGAIPPPLVDSPKCPRCSLVGICLPDETNAFRVARPATVQRLLFDVDARGEQPPCREESAELRRLVPARDDLRPLYVNTQGYSVGKSGNVLKIKDRDKVVQEVRIHEICQLNIFGNIQVTTQALQTLCENEVPVAYFSQGGWFYGILQGLGVKNIDLRREQFRLAEVPSFCLRLARALVAGKIKNQRTMLQRNHIEPPAAAIGYLKALHDEACAADNLESLLGIEGNAARAYFQNFAGMIRPDQDSHVATNGEFRFDFAHRNRRPPRDPVNALLSLAYSVLAKDLTIICQAVGFDPFLGFFHQPRFGRASLALDLMEPFRPLIADSAVLTAINTRMLSTADFIRAGEAVSLRPEGRKAFFRAYEQRLDTLVTHPLFGYRVNYRRILEIQARLLIRLLTGELNAYPPFVTR